MQFRVTHRFGGMDRTDDLGVIDALLDELTGDDDPEHPDVAVSYEDWSLSVFNGGTVIWGNVEKGDEERHLTGLSSDEVRELARMVARGDLDAVEAYPWRPGYPWP